MKGTPRVVAAYILARYKHGQTGKEGIPLRVGRCRHRPLLALSPGAEAERDSAVESLERITQKYNDLKRMRNIKRVTFVGGA